MNVPYDLSNVLFVCTANTTDTIPEPLLNRMEVISFPGYTAVEKYHIAKKHLIPRAMETMGIKKNMLRITDGALRQIIDEYTMEAGVRDLKKSIETLCRTAAVELVKNNCPETEETGTGISVTKSNLQDYLGRKQIRTERRLSSGTPGVVTGLAWTRAGGAILFIETKLTKGKGKLLITGQLGDVMKESVQIALTLVRSLYPKESRVLEDHDLHVHVPAPEPDPVFVPSCLRRRPVCVPLPGEEQYGRACRDFGHGARGGGELSAAFGDIYYLVFIKGPAFLCREKVA